MIFVRFFAVLSEKNAAERLALDQGVNNGIVINRR